MRGRIHHEGLANVSVCNEVTTAELTGVQIMLQEVMPGMFSISLPVDLIPADTTAIKVTYGDTVRDGLIEYQNGGHLTFR